MTADVTPCTNIIIGDFGQPSPCRGVHPLHPLRADFQTRCFYGFEQFRSERRPRARARSGTCSPEGSEQNSPPSFFESHPATLPATLPPATSRLFEKQPHERHKKGPPSKGT